MPKMGESIIEATILNWVKQVGDTVEVDDTVLEIATDKVDSEVPSPVAGTIKEIRFEPDSTVAVGEVIALIETEVGAEVEASPTVAPSEEQDRPSSSEPATATASQGNVAPAPRRENKSENGKGISEKSENGRFYSPLVRTIAAKEGIGQAELDQIPGTGNGGRVNKSDIQAYLKRRDNRFITGPGKAAQTAGITATTLPPRPPVAPAGSLASGSSDEIIQMDRMRKLIAGHMVDSKRTSAHVTSFIEVDVTDIVNWREGIKKKFQQQHGEKITYTPIFIEAVAKAIKDFPMVNISVDGDRIIKKGNINVGMAAALPTGNLIVPVIRNADRLNLMGLTKQVNDLARRARENKLKPEEIRDGTFTLTNVGTFGNVMGTPIINQPQVAILAVGAIRKKPAVVETEYGDLIAVRQMMFMSLSYDHRVVDGFLGGSFLRRIGDYLEAFDPQRSDV